MLASAAGAAVAGRLDGDTVVCGYHGMKFNAQGPCVYTPFQQPLSPRPASGLSGDDTHRLIWLWTGAPALADPLLLPDMHSNNDWAWSTIVPRPPRDG